MYSFQKDVCNGNFNFAAGRMYIFYCIIIQIENRNLICVSNFGIFSGCIIKKFFIVYLTERKAITAVFTLIFTESLTLNLETFK